MTMYTKNIKMLCNIQTFASSFKIYPGKRIKYLDKGSYRWLLLDNSAHTYSGE